MSLKVFALFFFSWKIYVELALYSLNCLLEFTQRSHLDLVFSLWECFHLSCLNCFSFQDYPPVCAQSVMSNSETPWTTALHIPPSMGFSRQEYWSGLPLPSPWEPRYMTQIFRSSYQSLLSSERALPSNLPNHRLARQCFKAVDSSSLPLVLRVQVLCYMLSRFSRVRLCATP